MFDAAANWAAANCTDAVPVDDAAGGHAHQPGGRRRRSRAWSPSRPTPPTTTACFRVVFAVDGTAVRDRQQRHRTDGRARGARPRSPTAATPSRRRRPTRPGRPTPSSITVTVEPTRRRPEVLMVVADADRAARAAENVVAQRLTDRRLRRHLRRRQHRHRRATPRARRSSSSPSPPPPTRPPTSCATWPSRSGSPSRTCSTTSGSPGPPRASTTASRPTTQLTIAAPGHPMAAGRTGTVAFQTGDSVSWGKPTAAATTVARAGTDADHLHRRPGRTRSPTARRRPGLPAHVPALHQRARPTLHRRRPRHVRRRRATGPPPTAPPGHHPRRPTAVEHVIQVSVDGLNPDAITQLGPAGAPTFHRLMARGRVDAERPHGRRAHPQTLPNHTSVMTGRPVVGAERPPGDVQRGQRVDGRRHAGQLRGRRVRHRARRRRLDRALQRQAPKFDFLDRSWNGDQRRASTRSASTTAGTRSTPTCGAPDGHDDGRCCRPSSPPTRPTSASSTRRPPTRRPPVRASCRRSTSTRCSEVDATSATSSTRSPATPTLAAHTVVIVTSDHGGLGTHPRRRDRSSANYRMPVLRLGRGRRRRAPTSTRSTPTGPTPARAARVHRRRPADPQRRGRQPGHRAARLRPDPGQPAQQRPVARPGVVTAPARRAGGQRLCRASRATAMLAATRKSSRGSGTVTV